MATKMDLVTTRFDHHRWMANNVDLIATIKFGRCHRLEIERGGDMTSPLLLVLVTHKDGRFK
jgi:hypothetical protein